MRRRFNQLFAEVEAAGPLTATPPRRSRASRSILKSIAMPANRNLSERGKRELAKAAR